LPVVPGRSHQGSDLLDEVGEGHRHRPTIGADEVRASGYELRLVNCHCGPEAAADPVACHRGAHRLADGVRDPRRLFGAVAEETQGYRAGSSPAGPRKGLERRTVADVPDQAESRFRPRARRVRSTARPPRVRMRLRNPWVLERLRLFG
jgi:hypothetical protein